MSDDERLSFASDMVELFQERCRGYGTSVDVGHVLRGVLGLVRKHRVR
jgi:aarF domain-containing kinase